MCREVRVAVALRNAGVDDNQHLVFYDFEREDFEYPEVVPGLGCGEDQVDWVPGLEDCSVLDIDYLHAIDFALAALSDQRFEHLAGAHFLRCHVIRSFHSVVFAFLLAWGVVCCK